MIAACCGGYEGVSEMVVGVVVGEE